MVEIVPETEEVFESKQTTFIRPESKAVRTMNVGEIIRIKNHQHILMPNSRSVCRLVNTLRHQPGIRVAMLHDGPDLLVKRVS